LALFWFLAGSLTTLAGLIVLLPWLRRVPRLGPLPAAPWQASIGVLLAAAAALGMYHWVGHPERAEEPAAPARTAAAGNATGVSTGAANVPGGAANPAARSSAGSMSSAIATLESRLAKGGGSTDDWELLAKSFEFLGRPQDASQARAHQLPPVPADESDTAGRSGTAPTAAAAELSADSRQWLANAGGPGAVITGEVSLAAALSKKAAQGATLFIVAKSVDSPGAPVAVFRGSVGAWPLKFTLDDSQSMLPGRNLSSAGRVTVEARISQTGQPLPAAGDLQGSSAVINPADRQPLKILIDKVIT